MENVKSSCPTCSGLYTCYNGWYNKVKTKRNFFLFSIWENGETNIEKPFLVRNINCNLFM